MAVVANDATTNPEALPPDATPTAIAPAILILDFNTNAPVCCEIL